MGSCSRQNPAFRRCHLLGKDGSPTYPPHHEYSDSEREAALLPSQQDLNRRFRWKDERNIMTKILWKTPGWFTCMPFHRDAYLKIFSAISLSVLITTLFLQKLSGYSYPPNLIQRHAQK